MPEVTVLVAAAASTTSAPWDGSPSRFSDSQWAASCVLDRGASAGTAKTRYSLPIREPGGALNANAVAAAAGRLNQVKDAAASAISAAKAALRSAYKTLGKTPPDSISAAAPSYQSREGVEIARVGTFALSTGEHTFTRGQLASAVANAVAGAQPRIGIGHLDPRWNDTEASQDGDPALGSVTNLRLSDDGDVLLGDYVEMPEWFAQALPSAYPGRSIEATVNDDDMTIHVVKLLGTKRPGIHTLEDLRSFVSDEGPALVAAGADNDGKPITVLLVASGAETPTPPGVRKESSSMTLDLVALRKRLGLAEDATEEQINAALTTEPAAPADPAVPAVPAEPAEPAAPAAATVTEPEAPVAPAAPAPGTVAVDEGTLTDLKASAALVTKMVEDERLRTRKQLLDTAAQQGRFPLWRRDHYATAFDKDPEGTTKLLSASAAEGGLAPGLVPVKPIGGVRVDAGAPDEDFERRVDARLGIKPATTTTGA